MYKHEWLDHLLNLILACFMSFSMVYAMTTSLGFRFKAVEIFAAILLIMVLYSLVFWNGLSMKVSAAFTILALIAILFYTLKKGMLESLVFKLYSPVLWVFDYINALEPLNATYETYITVYLCAVVSAPVFFFSIKRFNFFTMLTGGISLFALQWILEYFVSYLAFYLFLFVILMFYIKEIYLRNLARKPGDYTNQGTFLLWSMPFCALVFLTAILIPAGRKPIEWKWMDSKISSIFNYINNLYHYETFDYFSIASTGFGNESELGGKVQVDKTVVLKAESPHKIYLRGAIRDYYTGSSWTNSSNELTPLSEESKQTFFDTFEFLNSFPIISSILSGNNDPVEKYFNPEEIRITYMNIRTKSLFYPVKAYNFVIPDKYQVNTFVSPDENIVADKTLSKGFAYSLKVFNFTGKTEEFTDILRQNRSRIYMDILRSRNTRSSHRPALHIPERPILMKLAEHSAEVYSRYLQMPSTIPSRVKQLARDITAGKRSNYDKIKAIESYLSQNYSYTLSPAPTPKDKDFVDYFLFELKEGYCTYYASAMVILARCIGIPARYVEGYMLPSKPESENTYYITNEQAHAWVEVYFEGFGWLPFEPTAPFMASFYGNDSPGGSFAPGSVEDPYYLEYMRWQMENNNALSGLGLVPDSAIGKEQSLTVFLIIIAFLSFIAFILVCIILINVIMHKLRFKKLLNLPPREYVLAIYKHIVAALSLDKLGIKPGETPIQYAERIDNYLFFKSISFRGVTDIFMVARYSTRGLDEEHKKTIYEFYKPFIDEIKHDMGRLKFWFYAYMAGRILV